MATSTAPSHDNVVGLDQLPSELYNHIYDYLDSVSRLSLASTSKHLRSLKNGVFSNLEIPCSYQFACMGERDNHPKFKSKKLCSSCESLHDTKYFNETEIAKDARQRRCNPSMSAIKIRPGWSISWDEYRSYVSGFTNLGSWSFSHSLFPFIGKNMHIFGPSGGIGPMRDPETIMRTVGRHGWLMSSHIEVRHQGPYEPEDLLAVFDQFFFQPVSSNFLMDLGTGSDFEMVFAWNLYLDAFASLDDFDEVAYIEEVKDKCLEFEFCPHISTTHPRVARLFRDIARDPGGPAESPTYDPWSDGDIDANDNPTGIYCSKCPGTSIILSVIAIDYTTINPSKTLFDDGRHEWNHREQAIFNVECGVYGRVDVRRRIPGPLESACHPGWVSQIAKQSKNDVILAKMNEDYNKTTSWMRVN